MQAEKLPGLVAGTPPIESGCFETPTAKTVYHGRRLRRDMLDPM